MLRVEGVDELRLAAAYLGRLDKPTKAAIRVQAKKWGPMLVREAVVNASSHPDPAMALARSGKITSTNRGLVATFGVGRYKSGKRSIPLVRMVPYEFGANQEKYERYISRQRVTKRPVDVYRRAQRQMQPRKRKGYFIFPALADTTPTLVAMWVRAIADVARGGPAGG
jgi:hypothetical protein